MKAQSKRPIYYYLKYNILSKRKMATLTIIQETTRYECWDWNRPPWQKFLMEYDDDNYEIYWIMPQHNFIQIGHHQAPLCNVI
jgi:hypothetical protein